MDPKILKANLIQAILSMKGDYTEAVLKNGTDLVLAVDLGNHRAELFSRDDDLVKDLLGKNVANDGGFQAGAGVPWGEGPASDHFGVGAVWVVGYVVGSTVRIYSVHRYQLDVQALCAKVAGTGDALFISDRSVQKHKIFA